MGKSIAFVETSGVSSDELKALCREIIPDVKVYQLIDDSLIQEVNANCGPVSYTHLDVYKRQGQSSKILPFP